MTDEELQQIVDEFKVIALADLYANTDMTVISLRRFITMQKRSGVAESVIRNNLLTDLREGGQIFGGFRSAFKTTVFNDLKEADNEVSHKAFQEVRAELYDWFLDPASNTCPDCQMRSEMRARTWNEWEAIGLPQAGTTICGEKCNCRLNATGIFTKPMEAEVGKQYKEQRVK